MIWLQAIAISVIEILAAFAVLHLCSVGEAIKDLLAGAHAEENSK